MDQARAFGFDRQVLGRLIAETALDEAHGVALTTSRIVYMHDPERIDSADLLRLAKRLDVKAKRAIQLRQPLLRLFPLLHQWRL